MKTPEQYEDIIKKLISGNARTTKFRGSYIQNDWTFKTHLFFGIEDLVYESNSFEAQGSEDYFFKVIMANE